MYPPVAAASYHGAAEIEERHSSKVLHAIDQVLVRSPSPFAEDAGREVNSKANAAGKVRRHRQRILAPPTRRCSISSSIHPLMHPRGPPGRADRRDVQRHVRRGHQQVTTHNVIARLPGTTHPDETILYTGHWDHIGVGEPDAPTATPSSTARWTTPRAPRAGLLSWRGCSAKAYVPRPARSS